MLEIWGRKNSSNVMPVMFTIGEIGGEVNRGHIRHNVGGTFGGLDTDQYKAMNPNQLVPTMNDNGFVLWESSTIIRYLCKQYSPGELYPEDGKQFALADQWLEWHKSTYIANMFPAFWELIRTPKENQNPDAIKQSARKTGEILKILDHQLDSKKFILGEKFSMADIPAGATTYRYYNLDIERPSLPNIEKWYARLCEREAYQTHVMIPFGNSLEEWLELERQDN